jgi:hypothetical protein
VYTHSHAHSYACTHFLIHSHSLRRKWGCISQRSAHGQEQAARTRQVHALQTHGQVSTRMHTLSHLCVFICSYHIAYVLTFTFTYPPVTLLHTHTHKHPAACSAKRLTGARTRRARRRRVPLAAAPRGRVARLGIQTKVCDSWSLRTDHTHTHTHIHMLEVQTREGDSWSSQTDYT